MQDMNIQTVTLPIVTLEEDVLLPYATAERDTDDPKLQRAADEAYRIGGLVLVVPVPDSEDLKTSLTGCIGTVAEIVSIRRTENDTFRIKLEGFQRSEILDVMSGDRYDVATVALYPDPDRPAEGEEGFLREELLAPFMECANYAPKNKDAIIDRVKRTKSLGETVDVIAGLLMTRLRDKVDILEEIDIKRRAEMLIYKMMRDLKILKAEIGIHHKVKERMDDNQRQYYLREQMKVIQEELGEVDEGDEEILEYISKILKAKLPDNVTEKLMKEAHKLSKMPYASAESTVIRGYLDTVLELPWNGETTDTVAVNKARAVLDREHWGLQDVKERILEYLAVRKLTDNQKSQILCLVGAPGVGKTSIASSIARAMGRKFVRVALGGIRDESDIRGHRKTYIGSMPGRIMNAMIEAGVKNPVILLDEIDKLTRDTHGDPSSALLEVLDPDQNKAFRDHFVELPFDLSDCFFIATANTLDTVSRPLLDRMEVIELGSYTDEEKLMIAKNHLIPKQLEKHGIKKSQLRITDDGIQEIITCYTRESGVRRLEKSVAEICRKTAMQLLEQEEAKRITVTASNIEAFLGIRKFLPDQLFGQDQVGVVTGLAWTSVGGDTLEVEVNVMDGSGKLELTGNLGDVMKESAHAALSYIRANAQKLGISSDFYKTKDIHVHFPEGAVPKDGPSAGVTVCTAMVSALTGAAVRRDVAMTGEISLRGRVMAIGGLKEKTMAALRRGITTVIIPKDNERDLEEIDQRVRSRLNFVVASHVDTVLDTALNRKAESSASLLTEIPAEVHAKTRKPTIRQ